LRLRLELLDREIVAADRSEPAGKDTMSADTSGPEAAATATAAASKPIIAVFNSSSDTVEMLRAVLEQQGFHTVSGHIADLKKGELDFVDFIKHHRPAVIVYDISPPYDTNWRFLRLVRSSQPAQGARFILTTTNKPVLDDLVGDNDALEIIGKPYDLERVVAAVREALDGRH
jgi:DNA-binding NarL/FixJ family response regulator